MLHRVAFLMPPVGVAEPGTDDVDGGHAGFVEEIVVVGNDSSSDFGKALLMTVFFGGLHHRFVEVGRGVCGDGNFKILVPHHIEIDTEGRLGISPVKGERIRLASVETINGVCGERWGHVFSEGFLAVKKDNFQLFGEFRVILGEGSGEFEDETASGG